MTVMTASGGVSISGPFVLNGAETITFSATDYTGTATHEVTISVLPLNDPPGPVTISEPLDGASIAYGVSIIFSGDCDDPDLIYGDSLTFMWLSNLEAQFGEGKSFVYGQLGPGKHTVTLKVMDKADQVSSTSVNITILGGSDDATSDGSEEEPEGSSNKASGDEAGSIDDPAVQGILAAAIVAVILALAGLMFMANQRKKKELEMEEKERKEKGEVLVGEAIKPDEMPKQAAPPPVPQGGWQAQPGYQAGYGAQPALQYPAQQAGGGVAAQYPQSDQYPAQLGSQDNTSQESSLPYSPPY